MELLAETYPEYNWLPWKFNNFSSKSVLNKKKFYIEWMANKLSIKEMSDWYKITAEVEFSAKFPI